MLYASTRLWRALKNIELRNSSTRVLKNAMRDADPGARLLVLLEFLSARVLEFLSSSL
jgi:hypothetical protein